MAQQLGGLRPAMYNWLVFGKEPIVATPQCPPDPDRVEGIADESSVPESSVIFPENASECDLPFPFHMAIAVLG